MEKKQSSIILFYLEHYVIDTIIRGSENNRKYTKSKSATRHIKENEKERKRNVHVL